MGNAKERVKSGHAINLEAATALLGVLLAGVGTKIYPDYRLYSNSPWSPGWEAPEVPADRRWPATATFGEPGEYVVRVMATDGGLTDHRDVHVSVR